MSNSASYTSLDTHPGTYTYWATQTVDGCESERSSVSYRIKPLPPAPTITGESLICSYASNPSFTATGVGETIKWYTDGDVWIQDGDVLEHDLSNGQTGNIV